MGGQRFLRMLAELEKYFNDIPSKMAISQLKDRIQKYDAWPEDKKSEQEFKVPQELLNNPNSYALFTDGACRGNPGPGSWAVLAQDSSGKILFEISGVETLTTNNKMELEAAVHGLEEILNYWVQAKKENGPLVIYLHSDSKYLIEGMSKWVPDWKARGWKKADKKVPENLEIWQRLDDLQVNFRKIHYIWVKGHGGHPQNEYCDAMANKILDESGH
jgi:ribonuclease HI